MYITQHQVLSGSGQCVARKKVVRQIHSAPFNARKRQNLSTRRIRRCGAKHMWGGNDLSRAVEEKISAG